MERDADYMSDVYLPANILLKATKLWGEQAQYLKTAEECIELSRAILRK